ncbi:hypothetical protein G6F16_012147 [Rhizopus arrhizus]|nr:hypothetical protein G6F23_010432 [Rhizopus arrhizus]KAG0754791.1 hypothetical protein G6F24_012250 [Rhizopus arrhizus]KAG0780417.1 hypothetical protein G6F22_010098 [Rhizopus arrhizus]KAG0780896.1 hypothetical protein G6F21_011918 [Rhizopus arrhizus]KAG0816213.1 hypothetical protein G6F20_003389 [Rhizopus arrhizus]
MSYIYKNVIPFQVLQRDPNTNTATLSIDNERIILPVGGPYTVGKCSNIYVGDVWVMAGQSNMRGHGFLCNPFDNQSLVISPVNSICLYASNENWREAAEPTHNLFTSPRAVHHTLPDPTVANPDICKFRGASLGLAFAKEYQRLNNGIPVGLVACAHGGTSLEDWQRPEEINKNTAQNTLYGAMIDKIHAIGNHVAGILWYQGESDAVNLEASKTYYERFRHWLDLLRADTRADMPVAFVQIGAHRIDRPEGIEAWKNVQEHQRKLFGYKSITAGVASLDCSLDDRVHLSASGLIKVGKRLAHAAIEAVKKTAEFTTPICEAAACEQIELIPSVLSVYSIKLSFSHMENLEWICNEQIEGFELNNCENNVVIVNAKVEGKRVRLYLSHKPTTSDTLYLSYGMNQQKATLVTTGGSALPAFKRFPILL